MTYLECIWTGQKVLVDSLVGRTEYEGMTGVVLGEAKNGMLLIQLDSELKTFKTPRSIPPYALAKIV